MCTWLQVWGYSTLYENNAEIPLGHMRDNLGYMSMNVYFFLPSKKNQLMSYGMPSLGQIPLAINLYRNIIQRDNIHMQDCKLQTETFLQSKKQ